MIQNLRVNMGANVTVLAANIKTSSVIPSPQLQVQPARVRRLPSVKRWEKDPRYLPQLEVNLTKKCAP